MKGIVLGAGYAVRLYPLTENTPKPLLPINNIPMLERIIGKVVEADFLDELFIVSNGRFAPQYRDWAAGYDSRIPVKVIDDGTGSNEDRLGAVGDIKFVIDNEEIDDDVFIVAGDNLFDLDIREVIEYQRSADRSVVVLKDLKSRKLVSQYGAVTVDTDGRIVNFEEKPAEPETTLISICMYVFPRRELALIDRYLGKGNNPDAPGFYIQWLYRETEVRGYVFDSLWYDIGDIESYKEANKVFAERENR